MDKKENYKKLLKDACFKANDYGKGSRDLDVNKNYMKISDKEKKDASILIRFKGPVNTHDTSMKLMEGVPTAALNEYSWNDHEDTIAICLHPGYLDVVSTITVNVSKLISLVEMAIIQPQNKRHIWNLGQWRKA